MPEKQNRKLAAILFADIAGYTALMQKDEQTASTLLRRFQKNIEELIPKNNGQIINFYGDGALCIFNNPLEAVRCAMELQTVFQEKPNVPVRIGLHSGTVVFENEKIYGDSVNLASRIESMGVPGAVLFSKTIKNEIKNQPDLKIKSLGSFDFKNVEEEMEVFALANEGFIVPIREEMKGKFKERKQKIKNWIWILIAAAIFLLGGIWLWNATPNSKQLLPDTVREEKVGVAVFNNYTGDTNLDAFGNMASDWVTSGLRELKVTTSSPETMRKYREHVGILPNNAQKEVSLFELTGAKYVVTGSYYQKGDSLQLTSRLESTETGNVVYDFPATWGWSGQKEKLIEELSQKLKGYWAVREDENLIKYRPPKYEAYQAYLKCEGNFGRQECFEKALAIDPTFMLARIHLIYAARIFNDIPLYENTRAYILAHWDECSEYEKNFFNFIASQANKDYPAALKALNDNYRLDPRDLTMLHESAYFYLFLNYPQATVDRYQPLFEQYDIYKEKLIGNSYFTYFDALNRLGRHRDIIDFTANLPAETFKNMGGHSRNEIFRALMMEGDRKLLNERLEFF